MEDRSHLIAGAADDAKPAGRCAFCVYELPASGRGPCPVVPRATRVLLTGRGARDVCTMHAQRGTWKP